MLRAGPLTAAALGLVLAWALPVVAIDSTPGNAALGDRWLPALRFYEPLRHTPGLQRLRNRRDPALQALREQTRVDWWVLWNEQTWGARVALVGAAPVATGEVPEDELVSHAQHWAEVCRDLLRIDPQSLVLQRVKPIGQLRLVQFSQRLGDHPVVPSIVNVTFTQLPDRLVLTRLDCEAWGEALAPEPTLPPELARRGAERWVGASRVVEISPERLAVLPAPRADGKGVGARLAYCMRVRATAPQAQYEVGVDAISGEVLYCDDSIRYLDLTGTIEGLATPNDLPDSASNPPIAQPLGGLSISIPGAGTSVTAEDGTFQIPHGGSTPLLITLQLQGPFVNVNNQAGPEVSLSTTITPGSPLQVLLNPVADPLTTAQVNGFLHTNVVHRYLKTIDPSWNDLDFPLPCNCNINDSCNAFYDGSSINFFLSGNGCANTCYSSVIYHEYGHAVLDHITPSASGSYHEGIADVISTLLTNDPVIGLGFSSTGWIRNVDVQDRSYPQDLGQPIHTAGLIIGGAFWDLRSALIATLGPGPGLDHARHLSIFHLYFQTGAINPVIPIDVLTVDDDDGNLLNGTPHYPEIQQGFSAHGLDTPDLVYATFQHSPLLDTLDDQFDHPVLATVQGSIFPLATVEVAYRSGTGPYVFAPLAPTATPGEFQGHIPAPASPARVEYYLLATDTAGNTALFPETAPSSPMSYFVGQVTVIFEDFVGPNDNGWVHAQVAQQDDWQRGAPNQRAPQFVNSWDPLAAFSAPRVWGNDLAPPPNWNGNYQNNASNYLESPAIDCSQHASVWLLYRRWLTVESGQYDQAQVRVNGTLVFANAMATNHADSQWVEAWHDISSLAAQQPAVRVRFSLAADPGVTFGGWNVDDVRLVSVTESNPEVFSLSAPLASIPAGGVSELPVQGRNDQPVTGYSIVGAIDPSAFEVIGVSLAGTISEFPTPDFFGPQISAQHYGAEVYLDFFLQRTIPVGQDHSLLAVQYRVPVTAVAGSVIPLVLVDGLGAPPLANALHTATGILTPTLAAGQLTVLAPTTPQFVRGDSNGDGTLNLPDAISILHYLFAQGTPPRCLDVLDVNDDGAVNLGDAIHLLGYLFQQGSPPAAPWPLPGIDPTLDGLPCS